MGAIATLDDFKLKYEVDCVRYVDELAEAVLRQCVHASEGAELGGGGVWRFCALFISVYA